MRLKLIISSNKHGQSWLEFNSQEELDSYVQSVTASEHWGRNAYNETIPAILDEQENIITPEQTTNYPAEWSYTIEDITSQVEQEALNQEALKYLSDTDWYIIREMDEGTPCPSDIKTERAAARARIVR